ncbi:MAG: MlaD family protein [Legionellaceae bacterium]|nr:MlaD family protein [Legionellaceae bacterium]
MEAKTNYTVVGLLVLILSSGLLASALWLSVGFDQKTYRTYAVYFNEAVSGLSEEAPVRFNGVKVGFVKSIQLNTANPQQVILILNIEANTPITQSTTATLISQGITGTSLIGLSATSSNMALLKRLPGHPYPIIPSSPSLFHQLDSVLKEVSENVNSVSLEVKRVFSQENTEALHKTLLNLEKISGVLANNHNDIDQSIKNLNISLKNLANVSTSFPSFVHHIDQTAIQLQLMSLHLREETLPTVDEALHHFNRIGLNLESTTQDLKYNPSVIIRGLQPPSPGPGE